MAPYGYRAMQLYRSLPEASLTGINSTGVRVVRNLTYGPLARNNIDVYIPDHSARKGTAGYPVALFCHGGVWAAGEKWHYAPMASRLAQAGVLTIVMQYTLYPKALVTQQVSEVSRALSWALDHSSELGGDSQKVSLIGHSAGAHLCTMALLQRATNTPPPHPPPSTRRSTPSTPLLSIPQDPDPRMPAQAILISGVFDIARHYEYERSRGVHEMSTMKRAIGGFEKFPSQSPAMILGRTAEAAGCTGRPPWDAAAPFAGDAVARYIGFDRLQAKGRRPLDTGAYNYAEPPSSAHHLGGDGEVPCLPLEAARRLPHVALLSSCTDLTVPWYESADMYWRLQDCGVSSRSLVYNKVGHGDFVTQWPALQLPAGPGEAADGASGEGVLQGLPDYARDLVKLVREIKID